MANDVSIYYGSLFRPTTTAHAVMQLPEVCDEKSEACKAGYRNICEIGEELIRRAGAKIKEESPLTAADLDVGFRVPRVDSNNIKDVYCRPAEYHQGQPELSADNIKPDRTPEDLLFRAMPDLGVLLSGRSRRRRSPTNGFSMWRTAI